MSTRRMSLLPRVVLLSIPLVIGVALTVRVLFAQSTSGGRWEYEFHRVVAFNPKFVSDMNAAGAKGWELASVVQNGSEYAVLMKRRK